LVKHLPFELGEYFLTSGQSGKPLRIAEQASLWLLQALYQPREVPRLAHSCMNGPETEATIKLRESVAIQLSSAVESL
jgi:hypothetical protein